MISDSEADDCHGSDKFDLPHRPVAGRYRVVRPLGLGGMGRVWQARDELLGREVALKEISATALSDDEPGKLQQRAIREARAIAQVSHPNVVRIFDVVEHDSAPWIVMELIRGRSLFDLVHDEGPMQPARVARIGLVVLGALQAAHRVGILHRDVKPANVLIAGDGRVVLTDFGLATLAGDSAITSTGVLLGSPSYIAPERVLDEPASAASDLWSLGATLFAAVEGRPPYEKSSPMATLAAVLVDLPAEPKRAGILQPVLEALLEKDPASRATADEAADLLRYVLSQPRSEPVRGQADGKTTPGPPESTAALAAQAMPTQGQPPQTELSSRPALRRRGRAMVMAAAAIVAAMIVAGVLYTRDPQGETVQTRARIGPSALGTAVGLDRPAPVRVTSAAASAAPQPRLSSTPSKVVPATSKAAPTRSSTTDKPALSKSPAPRAVSLAFEAESYTTNNGTEDSFQSTASGGRAVGHTGDGDWVGYENRSLTGVQYIKLRYSAGNGDTNIEIRGGSSSGALLASVLLSGTADFGTHSIVTAKLTAFSSRPLFIVFRGPKASDIDTVTLTS